MRIAEVIGTVTLSRWHPLVGGARWVIGIPYSLDALKRDGAADGEYLVIYDELSAGNGQRIGVSEGIEAAAPFHPEKKPIDAYCAAIIDQIGISKAE
jgi:ethanolamine utilization protein EutN